MESFNIYKNSTNIYATKTGMLNIAPIKISGQYKIIVNKNNELFLDDYNNKRVLINKNQKFLPQLFNFLRIKSNISDYKKLRYGGFSSKEKLSYHIPLYVGEKILSEEVLPKYFVVNKIHSSSNTKEITDKTNINNSLINLKIIDLEKIGLINIFKELITDMEYPVYFNFDDGKVQLYGYDYTRDVKTRKEFPLLNNLSNQTYLGSVNNMILNYFQENNLIFTRFINVEFEFEHQDNENLFENIIGYYSFDNKIEATNIHTLFEENNNQIDFENYGIFTIDYFNKVSKQINQIQTPITFDTNLNQYVVDTDYREFFELIHNPTSIDTQNTNHFIRLKINQLYAGSLFTIWNTTLSEKYFEFEITTDIIKDTFKETLVSFCNYVNQITGYDIECSINKKLKDTINIKFNNNNFQYHILQDEYSWYQIVDVFNTNLNPNIVNSYEITDTDIVINTILETNIFGVDDVENHYIIFDNDFTQMYKVIDYFVYDGNLVIRTDSDISHLRNNNLPISIYRKTLAQNRYMTPIPFLMYNDDKEIIDTQRQYHTGEYIKQLQKLSDTIFDTDIKEKYDIALTDFKKYSENIDILPYVKIDNTGIHQTDRVVNDYPNVNINNCLDMKFVSVGNTSYITPNYFNIDKHFYDNSSNIIFEKENSDKIKYHWFLIKSETPEYHTGIDALRYFADKPKITSRIIDTGIHSETIFLGVKYLLPRKYNNFSFAVYLDFNSFEVVDDTEVNVNQKLNNIYSFIVNHSEKTLYLRINKFLDFTDLIRFGNIYNEPLLDLSLLYNVRKPYNTTSNLVMSFRSGGLLMCDNTIQVGFNTKLTNDWKLYDDQTSKWYICLKRNRYANTDKLKDLIDPDKPDAEFYVYSKLKNNGELYSYQVMLITLKNVYIVNDDYVWCEDVLVNFYDTEKLLIKRVDDTNGTQIIQLTTNIKLYKKSPSRYKYIDKSVFEQSRLHTSGDKYQRIIELDGIEYEIINNTDSFSLKDNYFEYDLNIEYDKVKNTNKKVLTHFTFDDTVLSQNELFTGIEEELLSRSELEKSHITLFERNQLWYLVRELTKSQLKFKFNTEAQVKNSINELLLARLYEYSNYTSIKVINPDIKDYEEYIKISVVKNDENVVIWDLNDEQNLVRIHRYSSVLLPYFEETKSLSDFQIFNKDLLPNKKIINIYDKNYGNLFLNNIGLDNISTSFFNIENKYLDSIINQETNIVDNFTGDKFNEYDINSIGLWNEINGNIISSLFNKQNDIIITISDTNLKEFEIPDLFLTKKYSNVQISEDILTVLKLNNYVSDNTQYISTLNKNNEEYIILEGIKWLLNRYYQVSEIYDGDNIIQEFDTNQYKLEIKNNYNKVNTFKIILTRK